MGEKQNIKKKFPFGKPCVWGAGLREHHWGKESQRQLPLSQFAPLLGCHWAGSGNHELAASSQNHCKARRAVWQPNLHVGS